MEMNYLGTNYPQFIKKVKFDHTLLYLKNGDELFGDELSSNIVSSDIHYKSKDWSYFAILCILDTLLYFAC